MALKNEKVQEAIAKLKLPQGAIVVAEPWPYGSDGRNDDDYMCQVFLFLRDPANPDERDSNHYAYPLPISPLINIHTNELVRIDYMPTGAGNEVNRNPGPWKRQPPNEYIPEAQEKIRDDLKPLHVVQPEGASFRVLEQGTSRVIEWQKWYYANGSFIVIMTNMSLIGLSELDSTNEKAWFFTT